jgi:ribosomal protein S18 acetylase RimI-like enzyme
MVTTTTLQLNMPDDLTRAFPIVKELRPHLDQAEFSRLVLLAAAADGYRLVAREERSGNERRLVAVMGCRILHDLAQGSHLYVDDLVVSKGARSRGHGAELLRWAEGEARRLGLSGLRLCTRLENDPARRFYEREGWEARSVAYKKQVLNH